MDEGRRFLRYVVPGTVCLLETWVLIFVLVPGAAMRALREFKQVAPLGDAALAVAAVLATGAIGFLLSVVHHRLMWMFGYAADYRGTVKSLPVRIFDSDGARVEPESLELDVLDAWTIRRVDFGPEPDGATSAESSYA